MALVRVDPDHPDPKALRTAAATLRNGGLVAFPTETVYGLGAHALDPRAVAGIYAAKGRPAYNPLIVHVADAQAAQALVTNWPLSAELLSRAFWPGPLTMVLPKSDAVPAAITAGLPNVGIRVPAHPVALALLRQAGVPVAAPSANKFTEISPTTAQHVIDSLGDAVDLVVDGGPTTVGIESTVVDLTGPTPRVLRPGMISAAQIAAVVGAVDDRPVVVEEGAARSSPGMVDRHYAPHAHVRLFDEATRGDALADATAVSKTGARVGSLAFSALPVDEPRVMPANAAAYAKRLYAELHALDERGCALILIERLPATPEWAGVRDRVERAAR
ncbi:MAG TPA: L-threonylcarbamoyladenylate synthase [Gemmatimonadaceae bacterium]|nr:L-threonylcarbamoyladenylate synthase [Gemmatimonadaceae bacterium]